MTKDPIEMLREIAATLDDAAASMSEHGFSIPGIKAKSIADEIEAAYMRLPIDADGVPIRPGDKMEDGLVCAVSTDSYFSRHGNTPTEMEPGFSHHVKPDPVESLLKEFAAISEGDFSDVVAEYAERIRRACNG